MRKMTLNKLNWKNSKGLTLIEMLAVLIIVGIGSILFYTVFFLNWTALDNYIARADLWQEMDFSVDRVSDDARQARQIVLTNNANGKGVSFLNVAGEPETASYSIQPNGQFVATLSGQPPHVLSTHVDFETSKFEKTGRSLLMTLVLKDDTLGKEFYIETSTEIYPRN